MRITWRNKKAPHQLYCKFQIVGGKTCIVALCNCGEEFAKSTIVMAEAVVLMYYKHLDQVWVRERERAREQRRSRNDV